MSNDNTFKVTGVSRSHGTFRVRFANDMSRIKVLMKTGNDNIELMEMPTAVSKAECVTFLKGTDLYSQPEFKEAIDVADAKYNGTGTVRVTRTTKATPNMADIKARATKAKTAPVAQPTEA